MIQIPNNKAKTLAGMIILACIPVIGGYVAAKVAASSEVEGQISSFKVQVAKDRGIDNERIARLEEAVGNIQKNTQALVEDTKETRTIYYSQILPVIQEIRNKK